MQPSKYLRQLHHKAGRHLSGLRILADSAIGLTWAESDRIMSYVTIECLNGWANFARAYFLSCTLSPWRKNGSQITLSDRTIRTFDDAIKAAMQKCKPWIWRRGTWDRRDEPAWHVPKTFIDSCNQIGCSNYTDILNAFSIPTQVFEHLPTFRNFYAHRNDYTAIKAKNIARYYSIVAREHPSRILLTPAYGRPQTLILDWIDDISNVIEHLCD
jgi:hypothetical protein